MNLLASMRYLLALNEHRHFGRAAQACHITQPALSNALKALEQEFGVVIVQRGRTYAGLTHEGERVLLTAQRMVREREILQEELNSGASRPQGSLRLGAVPTAMPVLAHFAALLHARHPGIAPVVRSMSSPEIEAELDGLALDLGLGYTDRLGERGLRLDSMPQYDERYYFVHRATHGPPAAPDTAVLRGPARGASIAWREAAQHPLCLLTPEMHNRTIVDSALAIAGVQVKPAIETNSVLALALSVVAGRTATILPAALLDVLHGYSELRALPLVGPDVVTPVGFLVNPGARSSRVMQAALDLAQDATWIVQAVRTGMAGRSETDSA
ncbi:LysR substrate-binding domain-containing protein [Sphingomonas sp. NCPPB 2930]